MDVAGESVVEDGVCKVSDILRLEVKTLSSVTTSELITHSNRPDPNPKPHSPL